MNFFLFNFLTFVKLLIIFTIVIVLFTVAIKQAHKHIDTTTLKQYKIIGTLKWMYVGIMIFIGIYYGSYMLTQIAMNNSIHTTIDRSYTTGHIIKPSK